MVVLEDCWTKNFKNIPEFQYQNLEEHLVQDFKKQLTVSLSKHLKIKVVGTDFLSWLFKAVCSQAKCQKWRYAVSRICGVTYLLCHVCTEMCTCIKVLEMSLMLSVAVLLLLEAVVNM